MKITPQSISDVLLLEPQVHRDQRGYFAETFRQDLLEQHLGRKIIFCQANESSSARGVLRGLHYQLPPFAQSKLVRVLEGEVLDVAVDIRVGSPTFGQHVSQRLDAQDMRQLFIPRGFAHGFVVLSESARLAYQVDSYYSPANDRGIAFNDPDLQIDWLLPAQELLLSERDLALPSLHTAEQLFDYAVDYY